MRASEKLKRKGLREKILQNIPTYGHYILEEEIREWDRSIREESIAHLKQAEKYLTKMLEISVSKRNRDNISQQERQRKNLHILQEKIRTQTYGFFPSQSSIKINRPQLNAILELDEQITGILNEFVVKLESIVQKFEKGLETEAIMDLSDEITSLNGIDAILSKREGITRTGLIEEEDD